MTINTTIKQQSVSSHDELILVVERKYLFSQAWHGLKCEGNEEILATIQEKQKFNPRSLMEENPGYKQIIPYLVFKHQDNYFLMQRAATASEKRLQNKFSIGIGGHIRQEDIGQDSIIDWAWREFYEEVHYNGDITTNLLGIINDDSNAVGQVHLGIVFLLHGNSDHITVKSELKSGHLASLDECMLHYERLENWSKFVIDHLRNSRQ